MHNPVFGYVQCDYGSQGLDFVDFHSGVPPVFPFGMQNGADRGANHVCIDIMGHGNAFASPPNLALNQPSCSLFYPGTSSRCRTWSSRWRRCSASTCWSGRRSGPNCSPPSSLRRSSPICHWLRCTPCQVRCLKYIARLKVYIQWVIITPLPEGQWKLYRQRGTHYSARGRYNFQWPEERTSVPLLYK